MHSKLKINQRQPQYCWNQRKLQLDKQEQLSSRWKMLSSNIIYEAQFMLNQPQKHIYIGTAKTNFIHGFRNHTKSFKLEHYKNDTELPKEYWMIKRNHFISKINWRIISKCTPFNTAKSYKSVHTKETICWTKGKNLLASADTKTSLPFCGMIVKIKSYVFTETFLALFRLRLPIWPARLMF